MKSSSAMTASVIKWFADTGIEDVPLVGGRIASLGEMVRELTAKGATVAGVRREVVMAISLRERR